MISIPKYSSSGFVSSSSLVVDDMVEVSKGIFERQTTQVPISSSGIPSPLVYNLENLIESGVELQEVPLTPIVSNHDEFDNFLNNFNNNSNNE